MMEMQLLEMDVQEHAYLNQLIHARLLRTCYLFVQRTVEITRNQVHMEKLVMMEI
jgi:hypothetical protein